MTDPPERIGRVLVESDWIYTMRSERLHHVELDADELVEMGDSSQLEEISIRATCGRLLWWVSIPGFISRMSMTRCQRCCDRLGYPHGTGSPKNDPACLDALEKRLELPA